MGGADGVVRSFVGWLVVAGVQWAQDGMGFAKGSDGLVQGLESRHLGLSAGFLGF